MANNKGGPDWGDIWAHAKARDDESLQRMAVKKAVEALGYDPSQSADEISDALTRGDLVAGPSGSLRRSQPSTAED